MCIAYFIWFSLTVHFPLLLQMLYDLWKSEFWDAIQFIEKYIFSIIPSKAIMQLGIYSITSDFIQEVIKHAIPS